MTVEGWKLAIESVKGFLWWFFAIFTVVGVLGAYSWAKYLNYLAYSVLFQQQIHPW